MRGTRGKLLPEMKRPPGAEELQLPPPAAGTEPSPWKQEQLSRAGCLRVWRWSLASPRGSGQPQCKDGINPMHAELTGLGKDPHDPEPPNSLDH